MAAPRISPSDLPSNYPPIHNAMADEVDVKVASQEVSNLVILTEAEYAALSPPDPDTLYAVYE